MTDSRVSRPPTLVWFRQDLRLWDNPAFLAAVARGGPIIPVFILDDGGEGKWAAGGAARWWLHHSLAALDASLRQRGSRLVLACGDSASILRTLARATGAQAVRWNRRYEPAIIARDAQIGRELAAAGLSVESFNGALLREPDEIRNRQDRPFKVFTAYWRHCLALPVPPPAKGAPKILAGPAQWPDSLPLEELRLLPRTGWAAEFGKHWQPGEAGAGRRLHRFVRGALKDYAAMRNRPDRDGTSGLSPHLHWGEIGPRQVWAAVRAVGKSAGVFPPHHSAGVFLSEIGWREFAYHVLFHFPSSPELPMRPEFERFPWAADPQGSARRAWERGQTGYPIVDAGMRQLWHTGGMHNRVRMIVASFLVKHLRLPWTAGARWFWDTLVDADLASNTLGWQWSAGCGVDAAPYFRIFAPVLQGKKFDPAGEYVRRWVPELASLPAPWIHEPWNAPADLLHAAGVQLGTRYPRPVVEHKAARNEALAAFRQLRRDARP